MVATACQFTGSLCGFAGMRESREKEIVVADWSYIAFLAMLEYLYTGSLCDVSNEVSGGLVCS